MTLVSDGAPACPGGGGGAEPWALRTGGGAVGSFPGEGACGEVGVWRCC